MADRKANASWTGSLTEGKGTVALGSGLFEGAFSFGTRFGEEPGTNPEELLGASLAGCYTMALNANLEKAGTPASSVKTEAVVHLGKDDSGFVIKGIDLHVVAAVEGLDDQAFQETAEKVSKACPISRALAATNITLHAELA